MYWRDNIGFTMSFDEYYIKMLEERQESKRTYYKNKRYLEDDCWANIGDIY